MKIGEEHVKSGKMRLQFAAHFLTNHLRLVHITNQCELCNGGKLSEQSGAQDGDRHSFHLRPVRVVVQTEVAQQLLTLGGRQHQVSDRGHRTGRSHGGLQLITDQGELSEMGQFGERPDELVVK